MIKTIFENARHAIRMGQANAPCGIGYITGKGWRLYDLAEPPPGVIPEMVCLKLGKLPIPLTENGAAVLTSAIIAQTKKARPC